MISTSKKSILPVGAVMADIVCRVPRLPLSGEGIVVEDRSVAVGGCAFNTANIIRQLGEPCFLFAPVGQGIYADFVRKELTARGLRALDLDDAVDCGSCLCLVEPDGERTMVTMPGIEQRFGSTWFDLVDAADFGWGIANGYEIEGTGGDAIIGFFEQHPAIQFVYAPGPRIEGVGPQKKARINALHPVWHLNDLEALTYTGAATLEEAGSIMAAQCGNAVVITEGACGSHLFTEAGHVLVPTQPVAAVDTIGAGDAHVGAVVAARNAGCSWEEALALANRVATALCSVTGATFSDEEFEGLGRCL